MLRSDNFAQSVKHDYLDKKKVCEVRYRPLHVPRTLGISGRMSVPVFRRKSMLGRHTRGTLTIQLVIY